MSEAANPTSIHANSMMAGVSRPDTASINSTERYPPDQKSDLKLQIQAASKLR
jgi:hypothetical protein